MFGDTVRRFHSPELYQLFMAQRDPGAKHNAQLLASSLFLFLIKYVIFKKQEETNEENPKYMCVNPYIYIFTYNDI